MNTRQLIGKDFLIICGISNISPESTFSTSF